GRAGGGSRRAAGGRGGGARAGAGGAAAPPAWAPPLPRRRRRRRGRRRRRDRRCGRRRRRLRVGNEARPDVEQHELERFLLRRERHRIATIGKGVASETARNRHVEVAENDATALIGRRHRDRRVERQRLQGRRRRAAV